MPSISIPIQLWSSWYDHLRNPNPKIRSQMHEHMIENNEPLSYYPDILAWIDDMLHVHESLKDVSLAVRAFLLRQDKNPNFIPVKLTHIEQCIQKVAEQEKKNALYESLLEAKKWARCNCPSVWAYLLQIGLRQKIGIASIRNVVHQWVQMLYSVTLDNHVPLTILQNGTMAVSMYTWWKLAYDPDDEQQRSTIVSLCSDPLWIAKYPSLFKKARVNHFGIMERMTESRAVDLEAFYHRWARYRVSILGKSDDDASAQHRDALQSIIHRTLKYHTGRRRFLQRHIDAMLDERQKILPESFWTWWMWIHSICSIIFEHQKYRRCDRWTNGELWGPNPVETIASILESKEIPPNTFLYRISLDFPIPQVIITVKPGEGECKEYVCGSADLNELQDCSLGTIPKFFQVPGGELGNLIREEIRDGEQNTIVPIAKLPTEPVHILCQIAEHAQHSPLRAQSM
jgi:hypothetical protein